MQKNHFDTLFHASMDAIAKVDADFKIIEINPEFINLFKYRYEDVKDKNLDTLFNQTDALENIKQYTEKIRAGESVHFESNRYDAEGDLHNVIVTGIPIFENNLLTGAFVIYKDVTHERKAIDELNRQKRIFESLFSNSSDAIIRIDEHEKIIEINENYEKFFGYTLSEVIGKLPDPLISGNHQLEENTEITHRLLNGEKVVREGIRFHKNGTGRQFLIQGVPIILDNIVIGGYGIYTDMSAQKKATEKLATQKTIFEALFKNSSDAICLLDSDQKIIEINEVFTDMFGFYLSEIKGKKIDEVISKHEMILENTALTDRMYHGEKIVLEGIRYGKDNKPVSVLIKGVPIMNGETIIGGYGIYTDISDRKKAEEEIIFISYHDPLTGLYNRRYFEEELRRLETSRCVPVSLIMADVNGLKLTNDAFGHITGDLLLKKIAEIILKNCRNDEIVARLSGDEFVVLLPHTEASAAERIVHRIKESLEKSVVNEIELSLSFGFSEKTVLDEPINQLFKRVEDHMYRNKLIESPKFKERMFNTIINTLHNKFPSEKVHAEEVVKYSEMLGIALQLSNFEINRLKKSAWLHDIGKIALPQGALDPHKRYDSNDWTEIKKHPEIGYRILNALNEMNEFASVVLSHHEKYDGSGYPKGLKGQEIPLHSRIISIADAYHAMTIERIHLPTYSTVEALAELQRCAGSQFDPTLVNKFIELVNNIC